jgi:tryptophan 2-C-methyltransferase
MSLITLVSLNQIRIPLVAPYALDILATALTSDGHDVELLDLNLEPDPIAAIASYFRSRRPDLVGLSLRNTGDLYFPSMFDLPTHGSYLGEHARLIAAIKERVPRDRIVIGGVGYSSNPIRLLDRFGLQFGVVGPGEFILRGMAEALDRRIPFDVALASRRLPTAPFVTLFDGTKGPLAAQVQRRFIANRRYYDEGGLAGVRTSNGCPMHCTYCVEPLAKGPGYLRRTVDDVLDEIDQLVGLGIRDIHTCDSEFNMPIDHTKRVLRGIGDRGYPGDLRFWAYCQPKPFDAELAHLMARAHVAGVNFGIDHTDPAMLRAMGKTWYTLEDIQRSTRLCHDNGIAVNHELLFGYPTDTPSAMYRAIDSVLALDAHAMGVVIGLAVLPGTMLARLYERSTASGASLEGFYAAGEPLLDPTFYVAPSFPIPTVFDQVKVRIGSERRRVMMPQLTGTTKDESNQLVGSERIQADLASGKRGAYWYHYPARSMPAEAAPAVAVAAVR